MTAQQTCDNELFAIGLREDEQLDYCLTKEQAAIAILSRKWNTNYYSDVFPRPDGEGWCIGGEKHFVNDEGDWDIREFISFVAPTKEAVLDHIIAPYLGKTVFRRVVVA